MSKDVAIIGASTAGLFTAHLLAQQGIQVRVFEATERIAPEPRTLIVTSHIQRLLGPLSERAVVNKIQRFELFADGRFATIPLSRPDIVVERSALIQSLARQAERSGAEIFAGQRFLGLEPDGKRITFTVSRNGDDDWVDKSSNVLVGADGTFSKVAQAGGWPEKPTVKLFQAVVELPKDMAPDTTRVWFLPEDTPYFYWLIPHSPTHGVLGLIAEHESAGRISLERFLEKKDLVPVSLQGARIPLYNPIFPVCRKMGESDVYLVGDAAGQVKLTTVGGVVAGLRGALGVAEAILNGRTSLALKALQRELDAHRLIRKCLHSFTQKDYVRLLDMLNPCAKHMLGLFTRDETIKLIFHLFLRQPRFFLLGLRSLLR
jgi:flavin-dependent dehydrogenase